MSEVLRKKWIIVFILLITQNSYADEVCSLHDVLGLVEEHAPSLLVSFEQTREKKAISDRAFGGYFGEVDLFAVDSHFNSNRIINPISPPINNLQALNFDNDVLSFGLRGKVPLDISGKISAFYNASKHSLASSVWREKDVLRVLLLGSARVYRALQKLAGEKNALLGQLSSLNLHVKIAAVALDAGRIARVEQLRLLAERARVQAEVAGLRGQELALRAKLASLMGVTSFSDLVEEISGEQNPPVDSLELTLERPDYRALEEDLKASAFQEKAQMRDRFPQLSAVGNWTQNQGYNGNGNDIWMLGFEVSLPLFDGGKRRAAVRAARSSERKQRYKLQVLKEMITAEIEGAKASWNASRAEIEAFRASIRAAKETARIQSDRFKDGRISAADLVDAEAALSTVQSGFSSSLVRWWQADDELQASYGYLPIGYKSKR